eukprot:Protomagalhaensia_sp_Gyna_25__1889@NODE_1_length_10645_cov_612_087781_g0_i0_p4_GENE_NODE_1_length_10645_cov_612_087781_g0_i0NODE_1_length_10645_cov_612_087781_g0_i0_p4_ORF_typecomplete_len440_score68_74tRNAsynt_2c/PF01411_19/4_6e10tRNA_SAD/PF07973_14/1_9e08ZapB/PF06005_12/1_8e04ZapB/PF06005_12/0_0083NRBF2/PF08961_10/0_31_NODE_1_length_10645_cov_612_087781_g0_i049326251
MTERLYLDDCYRSSVTGKVVALTPHQTSPNKLLVTLDQTCFYPTSGGQMNDLGELAGYPVIDVVENGTQVIHVVEVEVAQRDAALEKLSVGQTVEGLIDEARRSDYRQQHTGQHLVSAILENKYGAKTLSAHFDRTTYLDVDVPSHKLEPFISELERLVAEAVMKNVPITIEYEDQLESPAQNQDASPSNEASIQASPSQQSDQDVKIRVKSENDKATKQIHGRLRFIHIHGYDKNGCCGTHLRSTGEIGPFVIQSLQKWRGGTRFHYVLGHRCIAVIQSYSRTVLALQSTLKTPVVELANKVQQLLNRQSAQSKENDRLKGQLAALTAEKMLAETPLENGLKVLVTEKTALTDIDRIMGSAVKQHENAVYIAVESGGSGPFPVCLAAHPSTKLNCSMILGRLTAGGKGRGGGRPDFAIGAVNDRITAAEVKSLLLQNW